jgi:hypothetical protein
MSHSSEEATKHVTKNLPTSSIFQGLPNPKAAAFAVSPCEDGRYLHSLVDLLPQQQGWLLVAQSASVHRESTAGNPKAALILIRRYDVELLAASGDLANKGIVQPGTFKEPAFHGHENSVRSVSERGLAGPLPSQK